MKKRLSKITVLILILAIVLSIGSMSAFASFQDSDITNFLCSFFYYIAINARVKDGSTPVYLYYTIADRDSVRVRAEGGASENGTFENCTRSNGAAASYVTCYKGTQYSIHNLINESNYTWARLSFSCANVLGNHITGVWSPDSSQQYTSAVT